jgi:uncharacterized protein YeaO (DUF488 family)
VTGHRPAAPASPVIRLKRIYAPASGEDGTRVLVDRLWPRGISKVRAALTLWCRDAAPSTELRRWFGHGPDRWPAFRERYRAELRANDAALSCLRDLVRQGPVTLLYAARDEAHNEAVVLRDVLLDQAGADSGAQGGTPRRPGDPRPRLHP